MPKCRIPGGPVFIARRRVSVSTLTRGIDIAILSVRLSVCLSVRDVPASDKKRLNISS